MPSQLKSLELQGYKTFANKTLFEFSDSITVIVGPNGSGKSNIADSIRWVLGEQSYSLLRGKRTADMIFAGSEQRARSGMASATITFDNSNGWLPIDFSEVAITRRAYRDGHNEYLINGQRTRLRDVSELLAQSGLAERTYTIIGQGLVDAALTLKAEERRKLFEEAAGISLYRSRREESLRRLDKTQRNLERVHDIMLELKPRLRSLERQARRAEEYDQVKADLQVILREWYGYHWHRAQEELAEVMDEARRQENALASTSNEQQSLNNTLTITQKRIQRLREELNDWHRSTAEMHSRREAQSRELAVIDERKKSLTALSRDTNSDIARIEETLGKERGRQTIVLGEISQKESDLAEARAHLSQAQQVLVDRQQEYAKYEGELQKARDKVSKLTLQQGELKVLHAERILQLEQDEKSLQSTDESYTAAKKSLREAEAKLESVRNKQEAIKDALRNAGTALQLHREKVGEIDDQLTNANNRRSSLELKVARISAQLEVMDQADASLSGYAEGTRILLQAARNTDLNGILGALNSQINVPVELEIAITAALGDYLDAVVLENKTSAALKLLREQGARGVLLPINLIKEAPRLSIEGDKKELNLIGIASELVDCTPDIRPIINLLLGRALVVENRTSAQKLLEHIMNVDHRLGNGKDALNGVRVVTLTGEVFFASGPVLTSGVQSEPEHLTLLSRSRRQQELREQKQETAEDVARLVQHIDKFREEHERLSGEGKRITRELDEEKTLYEGAILAGEKARAEVDKVLQRVDWLKQQREKLIGDLEGGQVEVSQISERLAEIEVQLNSAYEEYREHKLKLADQVIDEYRLEVSHWEKAAAVLEQAFAGSKERLREREMTIENINLSLKKLQNRQYELTAALESLEEERVLKRKSEAELEEEIHKFQAQIDPAEASLEAAEREQVSSQNDVAEARKELSLAEHVNAQARIALATRQEAMESLRRRIEDDIGLVDFEYAEQVSGPTPLPLEGFVKQLPIVTSLSKDVEEAIKRKRAQLRRIGPVNPEARTEYREIDQRYTFLADQVADLQKAEADIRQVIHELDELMEREFKKTFDAVAVEFRQIFKRLFNGGSAQLVMTDPDDVGQSGIDIEARLPGRRTQGLSLLSGGERSLTANALVFSLLKVSPTPFCVLDEVDAMLDEANLERLRELLMELSVDTQFVLVTHNRNTVQAADVIYGITMGRDSVSQLVSLKPNEVADNLD